MSDLFTAPVPPDVDDLYGKPPGRFHIEQEPVAYETLANHPRKWWYKATFEQQARQLVISRTSGKRQPDFGSMERHVRNVRDKVEPHGWTVLNDHRTAGRLVLCLSHEIDTMLETMPKRKLTLDEAIDAAGGAI
jgi:hypothetical protein